MVDFIAIFRLFKFPTIGEDLKCQGSILLNFFDFSTFRTGVRLLKFPTMGEDLKCQFYWIISTFRQEGGGQIFDISTETL